MDSVAINTPRGRDTASLLRYEASRRPELAKLIERVSELSDSEIAAANLPMKWMRDAVTRMRDDAQSRVFAAQLASTVDQWAVHGEVADPEGTLYEYQGGDCFIASGGSHLEVRTGKLFFVTGGTVWLESAQIRPTQQFMSYSRSVGRSTRLGYARALQDRLQRLHPNPAHTVLVGADAGPVAAPQPLAHLGVTIQR